MSALISVADWLGHRGEPLEPERMQYATREATSCRSCLFDGQRADICERACQAAVRAGLEHCEQGVIYVTREVDPRQIVIPA
jgi:hypothetical protein